MPSPQSPPSTSKTSSPSKESSNGLAQDERNGNSPSPVSNGVEDMEHDKSEGDKSSPAELLRVQKLKARAVMMGQASEEKKEEKGEKLVHGKSATNGEAKTPAPTANGMIQTRKRSRSGNLISRPSETEMTARRRGPHDADGTGLNKSKTAEFAERDLIHWSAVVQDAVLDEAIHMSKAEENKQLAHLSDQYGKGALPTFKTLHLSPPSVDKYQAIRGMPNAQLARPGQDGGQMQALHSRGYAQPYATDQMRSGKRPTRKINLFRRDLLKHADQLDDLVPIRLDIEWDHAELGKIRLRDTFTWNLHERLIKPDVFAETLVSDFGLSLDKCKPLVDLVRTSIEEQISDYYPHVFIDDGPSDPQQSYDAYKDDELRITVKLNITIGQHTLVDQFEWDLNNSAESAEIFARQMSQELSLSGEFTTAIAHSIREQCQLFTRSLYVLGHQFDGGPITDEDLKAGFGPSPMPSSFRPYQAAKEFTPYFYELNDAELEKTEMSLSREERRQKRSVYRRGGPSLPDIKDRQRTIRTLVLSSVIPGAAETLEDSKIFERAPATKTKKPHAKDGDEDSDDFESEDSSEEIPSHLLSGTARTRGMRGAAVAAQAAVQKNLGRSATPELVMHSHETRTSGRKRDYREESVDDSSPSLIIKLKVPKKFLQELAKNRHTAKAFALETPAHATRRSQSATPGHSTPGPNSMGPPHTPAPQSQTHTTLPHSSPGQLRDGQPINPIHPHAAQLGRVDASGPPTPTSPAVSFSDLSSDIHPIFYTCMRGIEDELLTP